MTQEELAQGCTRGMQHPAHSVDVDPTHASLVRKRGPTLGIACRAAVEAGGSQVKMTYGSEMEVSEICGAAGGTRTANRLIQSQSDAERVSCLVRSSHPGFLSVTRQPKAEVGLASRSWGE
jgi:hypothetical protein